jgi:TIR domain
LRFIVPRIFISYRRSDSAAASGRIYDRLCQAFGEGSIFKDVDDIPPGANYRAILEHEVALCDVLLVIIGQRWLNASDPQGRRRLDHPDDFVRIEIETGLKRANVLVIPVLVDEAVMPTPEELPDALRDLHYRNAAPVRNDPDFNRDITRLISTIQEHYPSTVVAPPGSIPPGVSPVVPQATVVSPASTSQYKLPWAGILAGVLLVIAVLATMRVISKIADNFASGTATAAALTATAQATSTAATSTPDVIATADYLLTLTQAAQNEVTPAAEATHSP